MDSVALVKQLYQEFGAGNIPSVLTIFDPAIE